MLETKVDHQRAKLEDPSHRNHRDAVAGLADYLSIMNLLFKSISRVLADRCGITTLQYRMLLRLLSAPGQALRATDFASCLHVGISTISAAISRLVEEGYVSRAEDPDDMRVVSLALTNKGAAEIGKADRCVRDFLEGYWSNLTPEQLEVAFKSSTNAVTLHDVQRIENGRFRLDTAFFDAVMISRTLTEQRLGEIGLKTNEFRIMLALYLFESCATASQVADSLFLKSSDVTAPLKALESMGLVCKQRKSENRRMKELSLTQAGIEKTRATCPYAYDALLETCHSNEEAVLVHLSAAQTVVALERGAALFA